MASWEGAQDVYGMCPISVVYFKFCFAWCCFFFFLSGSSALQKTLLCAGLVQVLFHYANRMRNVHSENGAKATWFCV